MHYIYLNGPKLIFRGLVPVSGYILSADWFVLVFHSLDLRDPVGSRPHPWLVRRQFYATSSTRNIVRR